MKTEEDARELARRLVGLGEAAGVHTTALLTRMDAPLGYACGNGIEVAESLEVLAGGGPSDVVELTVALARHMVKAAGLDVIDPADVLASGQAMDVWRDMVRARAVTLTLHCRCPATRRTSSPPRLASSPGLTPCRWA